MWYKGLSAEVILYFVLRNTFARRKKEDKLNEFDFDART